MKKYERKERKKRERKREIFRRALIILFLSCWSIEHGSG
jgi:hypothetical protein